jgi:hypothetical protein
MAEASGTHGLEEEYVQSFDWKTWGKRLFGRSRHGWRNNIKMALKEIGCKGMEWIHLAQIGTVAGSCKHGN